MLGIFIIYWIGRKFYDLATNHNRSPWGYTILGIAIYFITQLIFGVIISLIFPEFFINIDKSSELGLNVLGIGVGAGVWYLALQYLTKKWETEEEQNYVNFNDEINNIGRDIQN